jgi:hypothetical protein
MFASIWEKDRYLARLVRGRIRRQEKAKTRFDCIAYGSRDSRSHFGREIGLMHSQLASMFMPGAGSTDSAYIARAPNRSKKGGK